MALDSRRLKFALALAALMASSIGFAEGKNAIIRPPLPEGERIGDVTFECENDKPEKCTISRFMKYAKVCALLVLKSGEIRLERYSTESICEPKEGANGRFKEYGTASVTKSITSTLLGHAIAETSGLVTRQQFQEYVNETVENPIPALKSSGYEGVTIESVLNMRSGIKWKEYGQGSDNDMFNLEVKDKQVTSIVGFASRYMRGYPIGTWRYSALDASINGAVAEGILKTRKLTEFFEAGIWAAIGAESRARMKIDIAGTGIGACCLSASLRDLGRFGLLVLNKGRTPSGFQLIPEGWFDLATSHGPGDSDKIPNEDNLDYNELCPLDYRYQWWLFRRPRSDFTAVGIRGQFIHIFPEKQVVIVQISDWPRWDDRLECESFLAHDALVGAVE